jgi:hypothetical protein
LITEKSDVRKKNGPGVCYHDESAIWGNGESSTRHLLFSIYFLAKKGMFLHSLTGPDTYVGSKTVFKYAA